MAINKQNLIVPTSEQARINGSKGGKASAESKKRKKLMKEQAEQLLSLDVKSKKTREELKRLGIKADDQTNQMLIIVSMFQRAIKGDVSASVFLRDLIGEKPTEKVGFEDNEIKVTIDYGSED